MNTWRSIRSYSADVARGSSPSMAAKMLLSSVCEPMPDAGDALIGVDQDQVHGHDPVQEDAVGVADGATPVVERGQGPVSSDPHVSLSPNLNQR